MNIRILVAHHKPGLIIKNDIYVPIQVGKSLSQIDLGIQGDNVGDNISNLNPVYCEMTAAYWGWKNLKADYVGLCHYRRYFTFEPMPFKVRIRELYRFYKKKTISKIVNPGEHYSYQEQTICWNIDVFKSIVLDFSSKLEAKLVKGDFDIVVPRPYIETSQNIEQHFRMDLGIRHIQLLKEIVCNSYPDFFPFLEMALTSDKLYAANMFIMKSELYDDYCNLVFAILKSHLKGVVSSGWCLDPIKEGCYSRVSGYISEILTSAFVMKVKHDSGRIMYVNSVFLAK